VRAVLVFLNLSFVFYKIDGRMHGLCSPRTHHLVNVILCLWCQHHSPKRCAMASCVRVCFWPTACCSTRYGHTTHCWKCSHLDPGVRCSILDLRWLQVRFECNVWLDTSVSYVGETVEQKLHLFVTSV